MTNFKYLQSMSIDELADWLDEHGLFDDSPWTNWFNDNYCKKCESIKCTVKEPLYKREIDCSYCELEGKCKFFEKLDKIPDNKDIIKMWLSREVEDND